MTSLIHTLNFVCANLSSSKHVKNQTKFAEYFTLPTAKPIATPTTVHILFDANRHSAKMAAFLALSFFNSSKLIYIIVLLAHCVKAIIKL